MGERPFLAAPHEVRSILSGRQTMFRRMVRPQPANDWRPVVGLYFPTRVDRHGDEYPGEEVFGASDAEYGRVCPFGQPGDRLWVRETWCPQADADGRTLDDKFWYAADGQEVFLSDGDGGTAWRKDGRARSPWRSPLFMPRAASRITLEVLSVKVERLQDISEEDAKAEGARYFADLPSIHPYGQDARWSMEEPASTQECLGTARFAFANLWNRLNGTRPGASWETNPWVWAVSFRQFPEG